LQRAFATAGTRTVVASLWKVSDAATRELMVEFYRNLWERRLPKLQALRQAQLAVMRHGPGDSAHPRYWAAWTLSGDPRDLAQAEPAAELSDAANVIGFSSAAGTANHTPPSTLRRLVPIASVLAGVALALIVFGIRKRQANATRRSPDKA
jgi:hypothetical protein